MKSLKTKIMIILFLLLLIVCGGFGFTSYHFSSKALIEKVNETLPQLATQAADSVAYRINGRFNVMETIAENNEFTGDDASWEKLKLMLDKETANVGYFRMGFSDIDGNAIFNDGTTANISDTYYFKKAIEGNRIITSPMVNEDGKTSILIVINGMN